MFKLDDNFLQELGLGSLPADEKSKMLSHILDTLESRVGTKLASGMSNEQLDEFERFIAGNDAEYARSFLNQVKPGWEHEDGCKKIYLASSERAKKQGVKFNDTSLINEQAALTWLETNFPDYKSVVNQELESLKIEIKQAAPHILAEAAASHSHQRQDGNTQEG